MCWCHQEPLPGVTMEDEKKMQRSDIHRCFPQHSAKMVVMPESLESHVWFHLVSFRQGKVSQDQATVQMLTYQHYCLNHSPAVLFSHLQATTRHSLFSSSSKQKLCWSHYIEFINLSDRSCSKAYLRTMLTVGTSIRRSLQIEGITESTFGCLNMPKLWIFRAKAGLDESLQTPKSLGTNSQIRPCNWNFGAGHPAPASCPIVAIVE